MITSFSRLFRQIFGGPRTQPVTGAAARAVGSDAEALEAAAHRENLKRAMEAAFATPTAGPEVPAEPVAPLAEQVAAIEAAVNTVESIAEADEPEQVEELEEIAAEAPVEETVELTEPESFSAAALPEWHTVHISEPPVVDIIPALELAEVESFDEESHLEALQAVATIEQVVEIEPVALTAAVETPEEIVAQAQPIAVELEEIAESADEELAAQEDVAEEEPEEALAPAEVIEEEAPAAMVAEAAEEEAAAAAPKAKRTKKAAAKPKAKKKASPAKRKTSKKAAELEDGVWLSDAVAYSLTGAWSNVWTPPEDGSAAERLEVFREKAAAGELAVWGCIEGKDGWEPVKPTYWKTGQIEPLSFLMGRENVTTDVGASKAKKPVKYTALKVAQAQVEALWPPSTEREAVRDAA